MAKKGTQARREKPKGSGAPSRKRTTPPSTAHAGKVTFTHVDKVMFPGADITKGDLLQYYINISDKLLPHLRDRPLTLERMPDGVGEGKPRFWQKNTPDYCPSWIPRVELPSEDGKRVRYALVNDANTLAYLVNQGAITFHPFLSRVKSLNRPDFVLFDLDPGGAEFAVVVRIAKTIRDVLLEGDVQPLVKTSGKSGLHVLVPWLQRGGYDEAREWAMGVAQTVIGKLPDVATVERLKAGREGRVYSDVIQT